MGDEWGGLSGEDMVNEICNAINLDSSKTTVKNEVIRLLNKIASGYMFLKGNWPELIVQNEEITADGSFSYNLITDNSNFGRVIDGTVRANNRVLDLKSKAWIDARDPDHSQSGNPNWYAVNGYELIVYPFYTGTVYYDYLQLPDEIEYTTTAANISYKPKNHSIIVDGGLWLAMRRHGNDDWKAQGNYFFSMMKDALKATSGVHAKPGGTIPYKF